MNVSVSRIFGLLLLAVAWLVSFVPLPATAGSLSQDDLAALNAYTEKNRELYNVPDVTVVGQRRDHPLSCLKTRGSTLAAHRIPPQSAP